MTNEMRQTVPRFYTIAMVAETLNVSSKTVRRLIESGALRAHRVGRQWRIAEDNLHAFLAARRQ
jgi:excisionase family DNA binding protein